MIKTKKINETDLLVYSDTNKFIADKKIKRLVKAAKVRESEFKLENWIETK